MLLQFCSPHYCPNNSNIWHTCCTTPEHWDGILIIIQDLAQEPAQSPPSSLSFRFPPPHITLFIYTTFLLYFTAQSISFTRFLQNSSVIINNSKLFRTAMNDIKYPTLTASLMHMLTTKGPRTDTFANLIEKLQHFARPDFSLQKPGWLFTLQEVYPCIDRKSVV